LGKENNVEGAKERGLELELGAHLSRH